MTKAIWVAVIAAGALFLANPQTQSLQAAPGCATIQDGTITYSPAHYFAGVSISTGFDAYGYNYQAHMFSGSFLNSYLGADGLPPYEGDDQAYLAANPAAANHWAWPYRNVRLEMKWNDAWIANTDCDGDGLLDRHQGFPSYIGSGAWLTNHQSGIATAAKGKPYRWTYFSKIAAAPADAETDGAFWRSADGEELGQIIWGEFALMMQVSNDRGLGEHGVLYKGAHPGFGGF